MTFEDSGGSDIIPMDEASLRDLLLDSEIQGEFDDYEDEDVGDSNEMVGIL